MKSTILLILFCTLLIGCTTNSSYEIDKSTGSLDSLISLKYVELSQKFRLKLLGWKKVKPYFHLNELQNQFIILKKNLNETKADSLMTELDNSRRLIDSLFSENNLFTNEVITAKALLSVNDIQVLKQNVRVAELILIDKVLNECSKNKFVFNKYKVVVEPEKTNVKLNEEYHAKIYLAAYDSTYDPRILISAEVNNEKRLVPMLIQDGSGVFNLVNTKKGVKLWNGVYRIKANDDMKEVDFPFAFKLTVE